MEMDDIADGEGLEHVSMCVLGDEKGRERIRKRGNRGKSHMRMRT